MAFNIITALITGTLVYLLTIKEKEDLNLDVKIEYKDSYIYGISIYTLLTLLLTTSLTDNTMMMVTLVSVMVLMSGLDLRFKLVPDELMLVLLILATININSNLTFANYLDKTLTAGIMFLILTAIAYFLPPGGLGGADIKLFSILGLFFGWKLTLLIFCLTYFCGAFIIILQYIITKNKEVAMIPSITVATYITIEWGQSIIDWYYWGGLNDIF